MAVQMKRCEKCGKFYNEAETPVCPFCSGVSQQAPAFTNPVPMQAAPVMGAIPTEPLNMGAVQDTFSATAAADAGHTVPVEKKKLGFDPVVGWLVGVNGPEMGRAYLIHPDNNYIGRSEAMNICLKGDDTISRENQAVITYESRKKAFYIHNSEGRAVIYVNGEVLLAPRELQAYDMIEMGNTKLIFVPLCGEKFDWDSYCTPEA